MIACSCSGPRLHAQPLARHQQERLVADLVSITLDAGRGMRLSCAWNSPQRRWSGVKVKPGQRLHLAPCGDPRDRDSASQTPPRSIAAQAPPANRRRSPRIRRKRGTGQSSDEEGERLLRAGLRGTTPAPPRAESSDNGALTSQTCCLIDVMQSPRRSVLSICLQGRLPMNRPSPSAIVTRRFSRRVPPQWHADLVSRAAAELALFAGAGFLLFAINDLIVDFIYFVRRPGAR